MKQTMIIILLIACASSIYAEDKIPFEIKRIQDAKQRKIEEIEKQFQVALRKQKDVYIKRKDFESARLIDAMLIEVIDDETKKKENDRKASVKCDYDFCRFRTDVRVIIDHPMSLTSVPDKFDGKRLSLRKNGDETPLTFSVKKAGLVTIVIENGLSARLDGDGWVEIDHALFNPDNPRKLPILQKYLKKGEYSIPSMKWFGTRLLEI